MAKPETLDLRITKSSQSVSLTELLTLKGHRLRIDIKSDAYADQSHAKISVFSPSQLQWNDLWSVPKGAMWTKTGLHNDPGWEKSIHFWPDREVLLIAANDIL